jgi:hypothetical protein
MILPVIGAIRETRLESSIHLADSGSAVLSFYAYGLNRLGNRTSLVDHLGQMSEWSLDALSQLESDYCLPVWAGRPWPLRSGTR